MVEQYIQIVSRSEVFGAQHQQVRWSIDLCLLAGSAFHKEQLRLIRMQAKVIYQL